jgi:Uma2 family endonuclease
MATQPQQRFSFLDYLKLERIADCKSEFHNGRIYAMSGGTEPHSRLSARICALLSLRLSQCRVYDSNLKLYIEQFDKGVYPDCMVLCGLPQFWNEQIDVILNPSLVVEVLSPSSEKYDRGEKASYYRSIPSLQEILIVSQDRVFVEHSQNQGGSTWRLVQYTGRNDCIRVLNTELSIGEVYEGIL